jgi:glycerol-3-phosphate acyltransferase PlsY
VEQSAALVKNYPLSLQFHDGKKAATGLGFLMRLHK